jgi:hypothetical protein
MEKKPSVLTVLERQSTTLLYKLYRVRLEKGAQISHQPTAFLVVLHTVRWNPPFLCVSPNLPQPATPWLICFMTRTLHGLLHNVRSTPSPFARDTCPREYKSTRPSISWYFSQAVGGESDDIEDRGGILSPPDEPDVLPSPVHPSRRPRVNCSTPDQTTSLAPLTTATDDRNGCHLPGATLPPSRHAARAAYTPCNRKHPSTRTRFPVCDGAFDRLPRRGFEHFEDHDFLSSWVQSTPALEAAHSLPNRIPTHSPSLAPRQPARHAHTRGTARSLGSVGHKTRGMTQPPSPPKQDLSFLRMLR